jgi:hypothetical protein
MLANTEVTINLGIGLVFGIVCALVASSRGRSPIGWFFLGAFLSCIALVLLLVMPDLKQEEARTRRHQLENRRLREQLAKERQVADQRHHHVERRLGAHDQALGLDTTEPPQLTGGTPPQLAAATWYYARGTERLGPVTVETIRHLVQAKAISGSTLVWCEGMKDWAPLSTIDDLRGDPA